MILWEVRTTRDDVFPWWQTALVVLFLLADALYLPAEPRAQWLVILIAGGIAALVAALLRKLVGKTNVLALPGTAGKIVGMGAAVLALLAVTSSLSRLTWFFARTTFPALPRLFVGALMLAVALMLARVGRARLTMWALPTLAAVLVPLVLSFALTAPSWRYESLLPIMEGTAANWSGMVAGCILSVFVPLLFPMALFSGDRKGMHPMTAGILIGTGLLSLTAARNIMLLGARTALLTPYPTFAAAGLVAVGDFFQRAEALIAGCLTLCEVARIAVLLLVAANGLRTVAGYDGE